ncbi:hypothetical protein C8R47DRAFT_1063788 [Mycena vitilis]|nr:hypothetical protein C8R47DRAFT_1063788 [Mycena vitilis]
MSMAMLLEVIVHGVWGTIGVGGLSQVAERGPAIYAEEAAPEFGDPEDGAQSQWRENVHVYAEARNDLTVRLEGNPGAATEGQQLKKELEGIREENGRMRMVEAVTRRPDSGGGL